MIHYTYKTKPIAIDIHTGSDIAPRSAPGMLIASVWYMFTLIMVSTYTANLAAFLTTERILPEFDDVHKLAAQDKIPYGIMGSGSTRTFFQVSRKTRNC